MLDIYLSTVFFVFVVKTWQRSLVKKVALVLYAMRLVGVGIFELTSNRAVLFFLPDVFTSLFAFVEIAKKLTSKKVILITNQSLIFVLTSLLFLKLLQEYLVHISKSYPWELKFGQFFNHFYVGNIVIWSTLFILGHFGIFWVYTRLSSNR